MRALIAPFCDTSQLTLGLRIKASQLLSALTMQFWQETLCCLTHDTSRRLITQRPLRGRYGKNLNLQDRDETSYQPPIHSPYRAQNRQLEAASTSLQFAPRYDTRVCPPAHDFSVLLPASFTSTHFESDVVQSEAIGNNTSSLK